MLAPLAFLAFWIVLGLTLFFIASRGGPRGARATLQSQSRDSRRNAALLFTIFYVAVGIAVPVAILVGNHDSADANVAGASIHLTAQEQRGREIFGARCASCHTLAAAHANGKVGPNFDAVKLPASAILSTLQAGITGPSGTMPANVVQGRDAAAVAAFVARVGGRQQ